MLQHLKKFAHNYCNSEKEMATSSLAAVDPSDVSLYAVTLDVDMTLGNFLVLVFLTQLLYFI